MNYKIICPNKKYCGESASVKFINGEGNTNNEHLAIWFRYHGYIVEELNLTQEKDNIEILENTTEKVNKSNLVKKCKELGIPVVKNDTIETLQSKIDAINVLNDENGVANE